MIDWTNPNHVGAILGTSLGLLGALVGIWGACLGVFANKGTHRSIVLRSGYAFLGLGITCLVAGVVFLINGAMYSVWYPLLLIGFIMTVLLATLIPVGIKRYQAAEERLMCAESLRRE